MILQSLVRYYEALEKKEKITSPGWCTAKVSFALDISEKGELLRVIPLKLEKQKGKKTVMEPQLLRVPEMVTRSSGVSSNFLCDNSGYFLGIDNKGKPKRQRKNIWKYWMGWKETLLPQFGIFLKPGIRAVPQNILRLQIAWKR